MSAAKAPRRFKERTVRNGWTGPASANQPVVGDRIRTVDAEGRLSIEFTPAERIIRIDSDLIVHYHLANGAKITAPTGAHITWEEQ